MARLHVLGSGGWVPTAQRQTCCYLFETRRALVIFDAGSGVSRLHDPALQLILERHARVVVLLSHWHHDHVEGLHYLPFFLRQKEVVLGVPGKTLCGRSPHKLLERFGGKPFLPIPISRWGERFERGFRVHELQPGSNEILGEEIIAFPQPHTDPSVGFRMRDVAYVTDTCVRDETVALAEGAAILIHDAYLDAEGAREDEEAAQVHGVAPDVAQLAEQARVGDLLLSHVNPAYAPERLDRMLLSACDVFRRTLLASDMMVLTVKAAGEPEPVPEAAPAADGSPQEQESPLDDIVAPDGPVEEGFEPGLEDPKDAASEETRERA
jgi:ribonuclease BN (tRNA processing enzyme)